MSIGNQKVVRVTCQCVGISPRITASADCQLVCGPWTTTTTTTPPRNISNAPSHIHSLSSVARPPAQGLYRPVHKMSTLVFS